jgi:CarboxypepD_reg-like domain
MTKTKNWLFLDLNCDEMFMRISKNLLALFLIFISGIAVCQEKYFVVQGIVVDDSLKIPLPFATIQTKNKPFVSIANDKGIFSFSIEENDVNSQDSIIISCVGYQPQILPFYGLKSNTENIIRLKQKVYQIENVIIRPEIEVEKLMEKVIEKMDLLFSEQGFEQKGFYQSTEQVNDRYAGLFQSIVKIYSDGFDKSYSDKRYQFLNSDLVYPEIYRFSDYTLKNDFRGFPQATPSPMGLLYIKKRIVYDWLLTKKTLKNYFFEYDNDLENVYVIKFKPRKIKLSKTNHAYFQYDDGLFEGTIYVSKKDLGIERIHLTNITWSNQFAKTKDALTSHSHRFISHECNIFFSTFLSKYYLSYIETNQKYEDFGWENNESKKVNNRQILMITALKNTKLSESELKKIYGNFRQFGSAKIDQKIVKSPPYNSSLWLSKGGNSPFFENKKIENDLIDVKMQFEKNSKKDFITYEEKQAINTHFQKK